MGKKKKYKEKKIVAPRSLLQIPMVSTPLSEVPVHAAPRPKTDTGINTSNLTTLKDVEFAKTHSTITETVQMYRPIQHTLPIEQHVQYSDANIYIMQPEVQSNYQMSPVEELQSPGRTVQQLPSQSYHTSFWQSSGANQDSSYSVTSTSGGAERVVSRKDLIQVELTKEVIEVDRIEEKKKEEEEEEETEVNPTKDVIEMESMSGVIEADIRNAARLLAAQPDILADTSPDIWHKVIVKSSLTDRLAILSAINRRISPLKLTPYFFRMEDGNITFLVNNCCAPLSTLFRRNLTVCNMFHVIQLKVLLRAKRVNLNAILERIIRKRLSSARTFLDLSYLTNIPEFQQLMYDPSETSHVLQELVRMTFENVPNLVSLSLAGNEISSLRNLTGVFANKVKWWPLKVVDVSDNKIRSIYELVTVFRSLPITELYLHKNPLCGRFRDDLTYTKSIRMCFPSLIKLDGIYLTNVPGLPQWHQNYISCSSHDDAAELADQFVEHFFTLYDGQDRTLLRGLYHEDAYFSLSSMYLPGQSTSLSARLTSYVAESHNLLQSNNKLRTMAALCKGAEKVLAKLDKLPRTCHDPYSFTVDVLHHTETRTILTVTGVFKEQTPNQNISSRHFMRTFVLIRLENDEYQIVNDIMYVTNTTTAQAEVAFRYMKSKNVKKIKPPRHITENEKSSMTEKYSQLTDMRPEWSQKCLDTVGWDLREALETFIEMYKADKIPISGFITRNT